jgi:hypothetical protein
VTVLAGATTAYSAILGRTMNNHQDEPTEGVTGPAHGAPDRLAPAQRQQRIRQWAPPSLTLEMIVLAAQQGEPQRPIQGLPKNHRQKLPRLRGQPVREQRPAHLPSFMPAGTDFLQTDYEPFP